MNQNNPYEIVPVGLQKTDDRHLVIDWSDGHQQRIPFRLLRDSCRCAHCIDKHKMYKPLEEVETPKEKPASMALPVLSAAEARPIDIATMAPAGNYGYKIAFTDGHSSGIYSFELLRSIGNES